MKKDKKLIPKNEFYCYKRLQRINGKFKVIGLCPYWRQKENRRKQENGFCLYLGKGDWEINEERGNQKWYDQNGKVHITKPHVLPSSLLWDQCKECDQNLK